VGGGHLGDGQWPSVNARYDPGFRDKLMKNRSPQQLELFADGARAVAAARPKPAPLTDERLQAKLDGARQRLHEIVILRMKTWLAEETRKELPAIEGSARGQVRVHHRILERFRAERRRHGRRQRLRARTRWHRRMQKGDGGGF
jgi:hypothetical protein